MPSPAFVELVSGLLDGMGQAVHAVRPTDDGLLLRTSDGFLFAFVEDPTTISLASVQRLVAEAGPDARRLAVLTPGHLPLALAQAVAAAGGTIVEAGRFAELARGLGLGSFLGEQPRPEPDAKHPRLLPSARQLDEIMTRGRTWLDWGVPALALRFYRHAQASKPEFAPARLGVGRALLALGLTDDADRTYTDILTLHPGDLDARIGRAAVLGARGHVGDEIRAYRGILDEGIDRLEVRTHLLAALVSENRWTEARKEVEAILAGAPEDPQFRYLHAATLWKSGSGSAGDAERDRARALGLSFDRERALADHLGLPAPEPRADLIGAPPAGARPKTARRAPGARTPTTPGRRASRKRK